MVFVPLPDANNVFCVTDLLHATIRVTLANKGQVRFTPISRKDEFQRD